MKNVLFPFFSKQKVGLIWQPFLPAVPGVSGLEREPSSMREETLDHSRCQRSGVGVCGLGNECERAELESLLREEHGLFRA